MPGSVSLTAFFVLILAATCINASVCQSNSNCFGGRCLNGQCICNAVCGQTSAILPLCGNDGQYYFSYCHLMMQSCERGLQIGIRDNRIGLNQHCDGDKRAKFARAFWVSDRRNKICQKNSCLNFGVCVIDSENHPSCLCPDGYVGPRCEAKASLISNKAYAAMRPLARN
ncbi:follistatin-A-like isoform X2 [Clavelina lepadiformis]|uniref:follistatin-A-like isoform X2 n=1 Tax=Clavelina lepadiformis TaxID=159417 RepID=UPI004042A034